MPRIIAIKEIRYAGATHKPGAEFDASDKDARVLKAVGRAKDIPAAFTAKTETVHPPIEAKSLTGASPDAPGLQLGEDAEAAPSKPRRRYLRRDMTAEE